MSDTEDLARVAERAVRAGGAFLADEFRNGGVDGEFGTDDVKTAADRAAEERVLSVVRETYPDHAVHAEEAGRSGDGEVEWIIDPLDGTNNFASGLPTFATATAVRRRGDPVVSAVYEPLPDSLYLARRGAGATVNGEPLQAGSDLDLDRGTVSLVVGLPAIRDPDLAATAERIESRLRNRCKRVLQTWAPCVDWGLVARGATEGIVCFHPDVYEQEAGRLLAAESGLHAHESDTLYVGAGDRGTLADLRGVVGDAL